MKSARTYGRLIRASSRSSGSPPIGLFPLQITAQSHAVGPGPYLGAYLAPITVPIEH